MLHIERAEVPMKDFEELMACSPSSPFCLFTYYCLNLGDHIQTLALLQHVTPRTLLPRDHLTAQEDLFLLANGWLTVGKLPSREDFRDIKYVGVHLAPHCRDLTAVNAMKDCGVIGCRDTVTVDFLEANGVETYLTGCATLTFPRYTGKREGIYCVDVSDEIKEKTLQFYKEPIFVSHDLEDLSLDQAKDGILTDQYRRAYALLTKYMKAELVISSRVHATLPCIAFGTPVIYVGVPKSMDDRVSVLDGMKVQTINGASGSLSQHLRKPLPIDASLKRERYLQFLQRCVSNALKG
jgi:Polysaccharide pyruvyl transferase